MALRFGFRPDREDGPTDFAGWATAFSELAEKVSAVRKYVDQEASGSISASKNPDSLPRQIVATVKNTVSTAFPVFSRSTRRLRVAVCVSGQLRGFRSTVPTWRKLLTNTDATFFVDTWKKTGRGTPEPFRYVLPFEGEHFCAEYRSIGTELGLETLRERYPVLFSRFEESGEVTAEGLAEIYKTPHVRVDCETEPMFRDLSNSEKMHLKVEQCHAMMEQSGAEFDVVVRIRPDKPITAVAFDWPDLVDALKATPCLYGETQMGTHYGALLMGDQFAVGLPGVSRVYSTTYSQSREFFQHQLYKMEPRLTGHSSFAQICWLHGIEVRKVPIKFGDFREAEKMPAQEIRHALERDCANRMDKNDNRLLAAISADCDG
ncbi:hypothetical protein [Kiloniella litopenaei]|uniref:hypothetical protein n=1 Tax=Kiloniella litopenaei TaxID=1549748 RepID=UPI003BAA65DE